MVGSVIEEKILRPRRELLIALIEVTAVVAKGSWAFRSIPDSPNRCTPYPAVRAPPCLSFPKQNVSYHD